MGYSCSDKASRTLELIGKVCVEQTDTQNVYVHNGKRYFFEASRKEHTDGAITGAINRWDTDGTYKQTGSFRIEPDGTISRWTCCPVKWKNPFRRFEELRGKLFGNTMFSEVQDTPENREYDFLYPVVIPVLHRERV